MEIAEFKIHIQNLSLDDWNRLFSYIPLIQKSEKFGTWIEMDIDNGIFFPYVIPIKLVNDFCKLMYEMNLLIEFNWTKWVDGKKILSDGNFKNIDTITLFQLLTAIIRSDRFSEGVLVSAFENEIILNILIELKATIGKNTIS
ncbi:MAG: DUF6508 domain-containing protein [Bacteroidales bacterium]